jgi:hypothetical protein
MSGREEQTRLHMFVPQRRNDRAHCPLLRWDANGIVEKTPAKETTQEIKVTRSFIGLC